MKERLYKSFLCLIGSPFVFAVLVLVVLIILFSPLLALICPSIINFDKERS